MCFDKETVELKEPWITNLVSYNIYFAWASPVTIRHLNQQVEVFLYFNCQWSEFFVLSVCASFPGVKTMSHLYIRFLSFYVQRLWTWSVGMFSKCGHLVQYILSQNKLQCNTSHIVEFTGLTLCDVIIIISKILRLNIVCAC